jgi:FixJ family two-component response regulator
MYREGELISVGSSSNLPSAPPVVSVIDDDLSVREFLESPIHCGGWQPTSLASAKEFLAHPRVLAPSCLALEVTLPKMDLAAPKEGTVPVQL